MRIERGFCGLGRAADRVLRLSISAASLGLPHAGSLPNTINLGQEILQPRRAVAQEYTPLTGRIVFESGVAGKDSGIYVTDLETGQRSQIVKSSWPNDSTSSPSWLNKNTIVYARHDQTGHSFSGSAIEARNIATRETQTLVPKAGSNDICVFSINKKAYFSVYQKEKRSYDVFSWETSGLRQLTSNQTAIDEICPIVSPDGKKLAFQKQVRRGRSEVVEEHGLAVAELSFSGTTNVENTPIKLQGSVVPLEWSADSKVVLYREGARGEGNYKKRLFLFDVETGIVQKISEEADGATFTPDGKYVLYSVSKWPSEGSEVILAPISGGRHLKILDTSYYVWWPKFEPQALENTTLALVPGLGFSTLNGRLNSDIFNSLYEEILTDPELKKVEPLLTSLGGWRWIRGSLVLNDQNCEDTLRGREVNGAYIAQWIRDWKENRPNSKLVLFGHSLGTIHVLEALDILLREDPDFPFEKLAVQLLHGPLRGIDKPGWEWLGSILQAKLTGDCNLNLGVAEIPIPSVLSYPALYELKEMWDSYPQRDKYLQELVDKLKKRGVRLTSEIHLLDCVMDSLTCPLPNFLVGMRILTHQDRLPMLTQELPGAKNVYRYFDTEGWGHNSYLVRGKGLADTIRELKELIAN